MDLVNIIISSVETVWSFYLVYLFFKALPEKVPVYLLMTAALWFYFAGGTLLAYTTMSASDRAVLLMSYNINDDSVFYSLMLSFAFGLVVNVLGSRFSRSVTISSRPIQEALYRVTMSRWAFPTVSVMILGCCLFLLLTKRMVFHGTEETAGTKVDPALLALVPVLYLQALLCGYRMFMPKRLLFTLIVLCGTMPFILAQGRMKFITFLFVVLVGLALNRESKTAVTVKAGFLGAMAALAAFGFLFSISLRIAAHKAHTQDPIAVVQGAFGILLNGQQGSETDAVSKTKANTSFRGFGPAIYLAMLSGVDHSNMGAGGQVFLNAIYTTIPGAFWPDKDEAMLSEEQISAEVLHLNIITDMANTVLSGGYTDFREAGVVIYGFLVMLMLMLSKYMIDYAQTPLVKVMLFAQLLLTVASVETQLGTWFSLLRLDAILLLGDIAFCYFALPRSRVAAQLRPSLPSAVYTGKH